jgi:hypothetical protein
MPEKWVRPHMGGVRFLWANDRSTGRGSDPFSDPFFGQSCLTLPRNNFVGRKNTTASATNFREQHRFSMSFSTLRRSLVDHELELR